MSAPDETPGWKFWWKNVYECFDLCPDCHNKRTIGQVNVPPYGQDDVCCFVPIEKVTSMETEIPETAIYKENV